VLITAAILVKKLSLGAKKLLNRHNELGSSAVNNAIRHKRGNGCIQLHEQFHCHTGQFFWGMAITPVVMVQQITKQCLI